jgi:hypothetical protein
MLPALSSADGTVNNERISSMPAMVWSARAVAGVAGTGFLARLVLAFLEVLAQCLGFAPPSLLGLALAAAAAARALLFLLFSHLSLPSLVAMVPP